MKVVMVHGFWNTGRVFRTLAHRLTEAGHTCYAPTLRPRDGRLGIPDLSEKLRIYIHDTVKPDAPIALIGFSMGAVVSRYYLQVLDGAKTTRAFFAIAGPHRGTLIAYTYPGRGAHELRLRSDFLRALDASLDRLRGIPIYSYWNPLDLTIVPASSSRLRLAEELTLWFPLHALMPRSRKLAAHILEQLAKLEKNIGDDRNQVSLQK